MKIALVSYQVQERYAEGLKEDEDTVLIRFLGNKGLNVEKVVWDDQAVNWSAYDIVIIKSPWDYHEKITAFMSWLSLLDELNCRVLNSTELIRWNIHKKYLIEVANAGFEVIPSVIITDSSTERIRDLFDEFGNEKLILKPCISAGANNTMVLTRQTLEDKKSEIEGMIAGNDFLVQPFMDQITEGEWSLVFFGGKYSHALLKVPAMGDFRVQHYYGGQFTQQVPDPDMIQKAEELVQKFASTSLYARVDGVAVKRRLVLMEIELIEPLLYLSVAEESYENYYSALKRVI